METTELFYPQIIARVGPYAFDQGIKIEAHSSRDSYFDWAKIRFTEQYQPVISLARKDPASIELGYNGVYDEAFTGYVSRPYNSGDNADEITLKLASLQWSSPPKGTPRRKECLSGRCQPFRRLTPYMQHGTSSSSFSSQEACFIGE